MANEIIRVQYTSDAGNNYSYGMDRELFNALLGAGPATAVGGSTVARDAKMDPLPAQIKPRRLKVINAAGRTRYLVRLTPVSAATVVGETVTKEDSDGTASTYTIQELQGETYRSRRKQ